MSAILPTNPNGGGNPNPFFLGLNMMFNATFGSIFETIWAASLASMAPMSSSVEGFGWTDPGKRANEWIDTRKADQPAPRTYYLAVRNWEASLEIDRFEADDDKYGLYQRAITDKAKMLAK